MVIALCEYMVQLPILSLATPIFLMKFATVEALQSSIIIIIIITEQSALLVCSGLHTVCANAVAIVDTVIYNCSIASFILTLKLNV